MRGINPCVSAADSKTGVPPLVYRPKTRGLSDQSPVGANGDHRLTARQDENAKWPARRAGREGEVLQSLSGGVAGLGRLHPVPFQCRHEILQCMNAGFLGVPAPLGQGLQHLGGVAAGLAPDRLQAQPVLIDGGQGVVVSSH